MPISPWEFCKKGWTTSPRTYCQQSNGYHSVYSQQVLWLAPGLIGLRMTTSQITCIQWEDYFESLNPFHVECGLRWTIPWIADTQWEDYFWSLNLFHTESRLRGTITWVSGTQWENYFGLLKIMASNTCSSILNHAVFRHCEWHLNSFCEIGMTYMPTDFTENEST